MRINPIIQSTMIRFALLFMILFSVVASSCSGRKNKPDRDGLISQKELVSILTDVYIADGLLTLPKVHYWFSSLDTLSSYNHIIEKHGYSKATMDKTMKYYYIKRPKVLIKIYDQVLGILSEMESLAQKELLLSQEHISNIWTGKEYYSFFGSSDVDSSGFDITLKSPGIYTLVFTATLFPDDQSFNPRITAFVSHPDSIMTGKRKYFETIGYIKDGQPHIYSLIISIPKDIPLRLRGFFYDFDNHPDESGEHGIVEKISLSLTSPMV